MSQKKPDTFFIVLSLFPLAVALWLSYLVGSEILYANSVSGWKNTEAVVKKAYKKRVTNKTTSRSTSKTVVTFQYTYEIGGKKYKNDRFAFGISDISEDEVENYKVKDKIQIFYDPDAPSFSTVNKEYRFGFWTAVYIGAALAAAYLFFLAFKSAFA